MSKLRKAPPGSPERSASSLSSNVSVSRTLQFAQDVTVSLWPVSESRIKPQPTRSQFAAPSLASPAEQYWAVRAMSAETLLSAREAHQRQLQDLVEAEEIKRACEISALTEQHKERHASLERSVTLLLGLVVLLVALIIYLATHYTRQSAARAIPSHFTIPILSPFTSVVEHETSVIGSKTITMILLMVAALSYLIIRLRFVRTAA